MILWLRNFWNEINRYSCWFLTVLCPHFTEWKSNNTVRDARTVITSNRTKGNYGFKISAEILIQLFMDTNPSCPKQLNTIIT